MNSSTFQVSVPVRIRLCTATDLTDLEWFGMFAAHRDIIRSTFEAQERGASAMIIAEANRFPIGQVWVDFANVKESVGFLWALRVIPGFQRLEIGSRLVEAAEELLRERGFLYSEITTDLENADARRLYESQGYSEVGRRVDDWEYTNPEDERVHVSAERIIHRKSLGPAQMGREAVPP